MLLLLNVTVQNQRHFSFPVPQKQTGMNLDDIDPVRGTREDEKSLLYFKLICCHMTQYPCRPEEGAFVEDKGALTMYLVPRDVTPCVTTQTLRCYRSGRDRVLN